jgi:hypothetical protein
MATSGAPTVLPADLTAGGAEPLLEAGDRLSRDEFERRYEGLTDLKKAELIEGTVYIERHKHNWPASTASPRDLWTKQSNGIFSVFLEILPSE